MIVHSRSTLQTLNITITFQIPISAVSLISDFYDEAKKVFKGKMSIHLCICPTGI